MKKISVLFITVLIFFSCEKILFEPDLGSRDPLENFDYLWSEVDKKYSYFELKNINWDSIRNVYRPQISANSTDAELFEVLANMLNELRDDHTNLVSPFNISRYNLALQSPANFRQRSIEEHYLPNIWLTGPFIHDFLESNTIGYVRYESFMSDFSDEQWDFVINRYKNTKGLIIDVRQNGGGSAFNIPKILGRFTESKTLVGYTITRNGPGRNDFSNREPFYITPYSGNKYLKPVVVLIDRGSYSATTFFALATKAMPNITLIGDTTGGGGGIPNGGQLPNGWTYRFSISQILDLNGNNYAEKGVPPDIQASFNWSDLTKDEILERAILELQ
jgi:C-terminal processing protease CtpA/Prc